jgi:hypothetical protein
MLRNELRVAEALPAFCTAIFVDRHGGLNVFLAETAVKLNIAGMFERARLTLVASIALLPTVSCNGGLQPLPSCPPTLVGICGRVTFRGAVPDSTAAVYVVAYTTFPQVTSDLIRFQPLMPQGLQLPGPADSTRYYSVPLPSGRYEWVLAVWRKQGTLTLTNADSLLREAGFYRDHADTTSHGSGIVVVSNGPRDSIDIIVDFSNMHPISYYFP